MPNELRSAPPSRGLFHTAARLATDRPRTLLGLTAVLVAAAAFVGGGVGDRLNSGGFNDPGSESSHAARLLDRDFAGSRSSDLVLLVATQRRVDDPATAEQGRALAARLAREEGVADVASYWSTGVSTMRAKGDHEALVTARLTGSEAEEDRTFGRISARYRGKHSGLDVKLGGPASLRTDFQSYTSQGLARAEAIAVPITLAILMLVYGSAVAALLPAAIGITAVLAANAVLRLLSSVTDISVFALNLTTGLGLGLAVDYALLIVRRYREELMAGRDTSAAIAITVNTAGRTVVYSAAMVTVSLAAMLVFPLPFLRSMAYAGITVVAFSAVCALLMLPAMLRLLGHRIDSWDVRKLLDRSFLPGSTTGAGWKRLTEAVMRRAPIVAVGTVALLTVLGLPFLRVSFGPMDDRILPPQAESRMVQDRLRTEFAGGFTGSIEVVTRHAAPAALAAYAKRLSSVPGVLRVTGPDGSYTTGTPSGGARPGRRTGQNTWLTVVCRTCDSQRFVHAVRAIKPPFPAYATGGAAVIADTKSALGRALPWAIGIIVLATLILVFLLTGSVLVPVQAIVLNALSLTAMFGAVVWVFQEGHLAGLLDFTPTGTVDTSVPVLMLCLALGLSMDYGVFLLARIKEEYDLTHDHRAAIVHGSCRTAGVISAAALVLSVVMVCIGTSKVTSTKMFGLGVALAVLIDVLVVRTLLVPAVLALTARATWWAPSTLRGMHMRFRISETEPAEMMGPRAKSDALAGVYIWPPPEDFDPGP